jgi:dTDP-4-amino-4,6-dideoxygalactose transaminase
VRAKLLPFCPPLVGEEEISEVVGTLRSGWITTGPKVQRFEQEFAAMLGAPAALASTSCTAALHLSLIALGVGPDDLVLTTPMTFCSGVNVIEHVGAKPILVDVEPDTLNIDPAQLRNTLADLKRKGDGSRVKAIMPVHLYGHPCEMDTILEIAREYGLAVIEDAAHALPARYKGRLIGSPLGSAGVPILTCYSFYATKNMTTGEGGMLVAARELVDEARIWSLHGMSRDAWNRYEAEGSWYYEVTRPGFKYNMMDIQAALGLHQLRKLPSFRARRLAIIERYNAAFSGREEFQTPAHRPEVEHAWHLYVLRLNSELLGLSRQQFIQELKKRNIATSVHFIPIHIHAYYRDKYDYAPDDLPVTYREYQRMVSLPLSPKMQDQDVEDVIEAVLDIASVPEHRTALTGKI